MRVSFVCAVLLGCGGGGDGSGGAGGSGGSGGSGGAGNAPIAHFDAPSATPVDVLTVPFPSDLYLDAAGTIRLGKLPGSPNGQVDAALHPAWAAMDGWGVAQGVFFQIDGAIDASTIAGSIHLYDLETGDEVPVEIGANDARHTVAAVPVGDVLRDAHRYGAVLTDAIQSPTGAAVTASADFAQLRGAAPSDARLAHAFTVVQPALAAAAAKGIASDHVVAATSYRTQTTLAPLAKLRMDLDAAAPQPITSVIRIIPQAELDQFLGVPSTNEEGIDGPGTPSGTAVQHSHIGWVIHVNFRIKSYTSATPTNLGLFELDAGGHPIVKAQYEIPLTIVLPRSGCCTNLPLVIHEHGVTELRERMFEIADGLAAQGMAMAALDLPFHGSRLPGARDMKNDVTGQICSQSPCDYFGDQQGLTAPILFFGLGGDSQTGVLPEDPRAGADNFRQTAAEVMQLVRALTGGNLSVITSAPNAPAALSFRSDRAAFAAQSLGTFIAPNLAAVDPRIGAFVLTSPGAGIVIPTAVNGPLFGTTFEPFLENGFGIAGEFNVPGREARFHPSLPFFAAPFEVGDGLGAVRYVLRDTSLRGGPPAHILAAHAFRDEGVPDQSAEPFGEEMGLTRVALSQATPGLRFAQMPLVSAPFQPSSGPTAAFIQYAPATHGMVAYTHDFWNYDMTFPPWMQLTTPIPVTNPTPQLHRQLERFLSDYFAGVQPTVIDPFQ